jgi:hypothetical protein
MAMENLPGGHLSHSVVPRFGVNVPVGQSVQVDVVLAPMIFENEPVGHNVQTEIDVALEISEKDPAKHLEQRSTEFNPNSPEYVPEGHSVQVLIF